MTKMPDNPVISQIKISEGSTDVTYDVKDTKARSTAIQFATCSTAAATGTKVVECSDFALANEAKILVKFDNTNSATASNLKLNVNGTGAKAVRYRGANLPQPGLIKAGGLYLFVYTDNLYWNIIGDLDTAGDGMFATCSTSADVATKEVTIDNFNNTEGAVIFVKFTNTNTATGTLYLKVNGSSSRMKYRSSDLATSGIIIANSIHAFVKTSSYWYLVGELYQHPSYTARTGKPTENLTPSFGDTVTISQITSDATGHVTAATDRTIKIPNDTYSYNSSGYGTKGLVPAPASSDSGKYLQAGSGWTSLPTAGLNTAGIVKLSSSTSDTSTTAAATASAVKSAYDLANGKSSVSFTQTLTSGTKIGSISINGSSTDIYCSTDTDTQVHVKKATTTKAYLMGTSTLPETSNKQTTALADTGVYLTTTAGELQATNFVGKINGFDIGMSVPSGSALTDTWTPMTGATSSANGTVGYVNAVPPKDGYNTKYLRADGTWAVPPGVVDHSRRFSTSSNGQDNGWSTIVTADGIAKLQDSVSSLYVTRHTPVSGSTVYDPPEWYAARHSVGLMFANQNQVAIMSMASNNGAPLIKFGATGGGPNGTPVADGTGPTNPGNGVGWYFGLSGTTATTYNLDSFSTTDTKVTQTISTGNANYGILMSYTNSDSTATEGARKASGFYYNPGDGVMTVPKLKLTHTNTSQTLTSLNIRIEPSVIFDYDKLLQFSDYDNQSASIHLVPFSDNTSSIGYSGIHWASSYINTMNGELNGSISSSTTATTQSDGDNSTKVATTAYVENSLPYYLVRTTENNTSANDWETVLGSSNFDKSRSNYLMLFRHGATSGTPQSWFAGQQCLGLFMRRTNMAAMISLNTNLAPTTLNYPRVTFATSKHASTSGDGPTATDGWYFSLKGKTASEYDLDDLSLTASSLNNSSNYDTYGLPLMSITPSTNDTAFKIKMSDGFRYSQTKGTTTVEGTAILVLGNNVAKNTAGNKTGGVCFYGSGTNFINLKAAEMAENNLTTWIPKVRIADSTLTATKVVYESTSGVTSGVTLNSGSNAISTSKPPTYFKVYMRKFRTTSGNSYTLAYYDSVDVPAVSNRATTFVLCDSYDVTSPAHATFTGYIKVTASSGYFKLDLYYSGKKYTLSGTSVTEANVLANEQAFGIYKIVAVYETHE